MKRIKEDSRTALYELPCGLREIKLAIDKHRRSLSVLVPYSGNKIDIDGIGISVNGWMVCVPFGHITFSSIGLSIPYESRCNPFFDKRVCDACNRLAKIYNIQMA